MNQSIHPQKLTAVGWKRQVPLNMAIVGIDVLDFWGVSFSHNLFHA